MDRNSELSNHILSDILTILSTEDLLKTSILSKRWHKLWTLCIDLYFDTSNVLGSNNEEEYAPTVKPGFHLTMKRHPIVILGKRQPIKLTMKRRVTLDDEFVKRVDRFVKNFQGTIIKSFMVNFCLDKEQRRSIDQWITFAIARQVQRIDLLFLGTPCANRTTGLHNCYKFNFALFSKTDASTLNHLRLENCSIFDTRGLDTDDFSPFKNLRSLSLEEVKLDGTYLGNMISSCPWLEQLCLFYCKFRYKILKIKSSSLCHLKIIGCYTVSYSNHQLEVNLIDLKCLKLNSLEYHGYILRGLNTVAVDTPMLKSIDFSISFKKGLGSFAFCATKFPKLEIMHVDIYSTVAAPKIIQPFKHLKELKLKLSLSWKILNDVEYDLLWILNILQASLLLQKLTVMLAYPQFLEHKKDIRDVKTFSHDEVKIIEMGGCVGNWFEIEFVMNVLKYAKKLEQIVLGPYWNEEDSMDWNSDPTWFKSGRERINEKFRDEEVVGREKVVLI